MGRLSAWSKGKAFTMTKMTGLQNGHYTRTSQIYFSTIWFISQNGTKRKYEVANRALWMGCTINAYKASEAHWVNGEQRVLFSSSAFRGGTDFRSMLWKEETSTGSYDSAVCTVLLKSSIGIRRTSWMNSFRTVLSGVNTSDRTLCISVLRRRETGKSDSGVLSLANQSDQGWRVSPEVR